MSLQDIKSSLCKGKSLLKPHCNYEDKKAFLLSIIGSIITKWKVHPSTQTFSRTGRPSKLSIRARCQQVGEATKNPTVTLRSLQCSLAGTGLKVHGFTISRALHKTGLYGRMARKKPFHQMVHLKALMAFATEPEKNPDKLWEKI